MEIFNAVKSLCNTELFLLSLCLGTYAFAGWIFRKTKIVVFQPLLISTILVIIFLLVFKIEYSDFIEKTSILNFMLGPSVVAIGYLLYEKVDQIKSNLVSIVVSITIGSFIGIVSIVIMARLFDLDDVLLASILPKSVTTPIAIDIAGSIGGNPSLATVFVIVSGIVGSVSGPSIFRFLKIKSPIAKGLAMGGSSHAIGTTRAIQMGETEGAISGLSIGLMGIITTILVKILNGILF